MADNLLDESIRKSLSDESVDEILAEIINPDGTFNEHYNNLFTKYMGLDQVSSSPSDFDLSDHDSDIDSYLPRYDSSLVDDRSYNETEANIRQKLGDNIQAYDNQVNAQKRPLYTSSGSVRYPTIGSGASEERVVYDADWENHAKYEQEKLQRYNEINPYNERRQRPYVAGGEELSKNSYRPVVEQPKSPFVDPISDDDDFDRYWARQYEQNQKKSFFQEGLRSNRTRNESALSEDRNVSKRDNRGRKNNPSQFSSGDWMAVEKNRRSGRYKKDRSAIPDKSPLPRTADSPNLNSTGVISEKSRTAQKSYISKSEREEKALEAETRDLRDTVASIVDKYDKKQQDDLEKKARAERLKLDQEREEQAQKALMKAKKAKQRLGVSETVCDALDKEDEKPFTQEVYDDFSPNAEEGFDDI